MWAVDITYLPMPRGFLYLSAMMDWQSRYVLAWRLSNTPEADYCAEALGKGQPRCSTPTKAASSPAWSSPGSCRAAA